VADFAAKSFIVNCRNQYASVQQLLNVPEAGFTGPDSSVNLFGGPQPGVVPGRFSNRKPQSYVYAAFCPVGPVFRASLGGYIGGDFWYGRVPDLSGQAKQPRV
jgi:cytochrome c peroxidase